MTVQEFLEKIKDVDKSVEIKIAADIEGDTSFKIVDVCLRVEGFVLIWPED